MLTVHPNFVVHLLLCCVLLQYNFDKTIVDSGTTDLRLPTRVYDATLQMLKQLTNVSCSDFASDMF